ncbi:hypothetical protein Tco_1392964 [Tanacetum coccineum]
MGHFIRKCRGPKNQDSRNSNQHSSRRTVNVEKTSSKAMVAIDGAGFDWSYMADDEFDLSNSGLEEFQQPEFEGYGPKTSKSVSKDISNGVRETPDVPLVKELVSDDKLEKKTVSPTVAKIQFVRPKQQEKPVKPKAVKQNLAIVNAVRANQGHPKKEDQGYVDSGCSRHLTGNMSYLSDFKEFDRGYVNCGGGVKGGKITSKGTLKTCKKQTVVATSSTEVEYVAAASCCGQGEGSTHPVESHHTPTNAPSISQPPISPTFRRTNRQESMVPQPRSPTQSPVADEVTSTRVDVRYRGATTTVTGLEAGQGSGNINKTPTMPHDSPLPRVNTLGSDEGKKTVKSSQARRRAKIVVSDDEDDLKDPLKQGRKIDEIDQDLDISLVQHDVELQGRYRQDMEFDLDVSTIEQVSTAGAVVTTASVAINTGSTTRVSTADDITMAETLVYIRKSAAKDKAELGEEERQRIARIHEAANSFNVEEWEDIQARVEANEELVQTLQVEEREKYTEAEQARMIAELINHRKRYFAAYRQLRGYSFDEIKTLFETTMRRVNTFVPISSEDDRVVPELAAESSKRDAEEELDQESSKRQKTGESSELAEEPRDKETDELRFTLKALGSIKRSSELEIIQSLVKENFKSTEPTDDKEREIWVELKRLFEPDTNNELWKLQKHIYDFTWKLYDSCGVHHVSIEKGIDIYMLVEKEYPLSIGTLILMLVAKLLVEQDNEMSRELLRKIFMQTERPRR